MHAPARAYEISANARANESDRLGYHYRALRAIVLAVDLADLHSLPERRDRTLEELAAEAVA